MKSQNNLIFKLGKIVKKGATRRKANVAPHGGL